MWQLSLVVYIWKRFLFIDLLLNEADECVGVICADFFVLEVEFHHFHERTVKVVVLCGCQGFFSIVCATDKWGKKDFPVLLSAFDKSFGDKDLQEGRYCGIGGFGRFVFAEDVSCVATLIRETP